MAEINVSVKCGVEAAETENDVFEYTNDNIGILDTDHDADYGTDEFISSADDEQNEAKRLWNRFGLNIAVGNFSFFALANVFKNMLKDIDEKLVTLEPLSMPEVEKDISDGVIKAQALIDSIENSKNDDTAFFYAFKVSIEEENLNYNKQYLFIATVDGLFFFVDDRIAFVNYNNIYEAEETKDSLNISSREVKWYGKDGDEIYGDNIIVIKKDVETARVIRGLRNMAERVIKECGGYVPPTEYAVEEIVGKYINKIAKGYDAYLVSDFKHDDEKAEKRLKKALSKYARKVRKSEVIGFIDTTVFGTGGDGILFAKDGIAFDYAFEKVFAKYSEIDSVTIKSGKDLVLHGHFSERKHNIPEPEISGICFNLVPLKECIEEILLYV